MKSRTVQLTVAFLVLGSLGAILIIAFVLSRSNEEGKIGIPDRQIDVNEESVDPVAALCSESEDEQLECAEEVLSNPEAFVTKLPEIIEAFRKSKSPKVRVTLAQVLGKIGKGNPDAMKALETALASDNHHLVRSEAAKALRFVYPEASDPSETTHQAMEKALEDEDDKVGLEAMRFLFDHPSHRATQPVLVYLNRADAKYKWKAIEVMGRIKDPSAGPPLLKILKDESQDTQTRCRACGVLGLLKYAPARPLIEEIASRDDDTELGRVAKETIAIFHK